MKLALGLTVLLAGFVSGLLLGCGADAERAGRSSTLATTSSTGEFASPIVVTARLASLPAVGETTELSFDVVSAKIYRRATITIELPSNFDFVRLPSGFRRLATPSANPARAGPRAIRKLTLEPAGTTRFQMQVRARAAGAAEIAVLVTAPIPLGVAGGVDYVFLTVGARSSTTGIHG